MPSYLHLAFCHWQWQFSGLAQHSCTELRAQSLPESRTDVGKSVAKQLVAGAGLLLHVLALVLVLEAECLILDSLHRTREERP